MATVTLHARPSPTIFDTTRTAVVVIDMQNDFASPGGMFDRAGIETGSIRAIVEPIQRALSAARRARMLIVYLKMGFAPDLEDAGFPDSPTWIKHLPLDVGAAVEEPDRRPSRILIRDTWNTAIVDDLTPEPNDLIVDKHRYSGFHQTGLERELRERGIETLLFTGATTSVCVESTLRDAMARDFHCIVVEDCVAEPIGASLARTNHEATLLTLELLFASITDSTSLVAALAPLSDRTHG